MTRPEPAPPPDADPGPRCADCHCRHFLPVSTRPAGVGKVRVRRECRHCGRQVTTTETAPV